MNKKVLIYIILLFILFFTISIPNQELNYIIAPTTFWVIVGYAVLNAERGVVNYVVGNFIKRRSISLSFLSYLPVHIIIYSIAIEKLLISIFGYQGYFPSQIILTYTPFPYQGVGVLLNLLLNPSLSIFIQPSYFLDLTPFALLSAVIITFTVSANIGRIVDIMRSTTNMAKSIIAVISLGLISGSSCCLSLPSLIAFYTPLSILVYDIAVGDTLLALYFLLPIFTIIILTDQFRRLKLKNIEENKSY